MASRLHVMLDLDNEDLSLPSLEGELHVKAYARWPAHRRPTLISSSHVAARSELPKPTQVAPAVPAEIKPPAAPPRKRKPPSDDDIVELHRTAQHALAMGVTRYSIRAQIAVERALCQAYRLDIFNDQDTIERLLEELHMRAFPAPTRPPRLVVHDGPLDVLE
jgi:hypothetical protein